MPTNDFLPFATGVGANVLTQAQYAALPAVSLGFSAGIAQAVQLNKVWRQASLMSSVLAQFIVDEATVAAVDDGTTATLLANLKTAVANLAAASAPAQPAASTTVSGILKLSTAALVNGGTDNLTAITPLALKNAMPGFTGALGSIQLPNGLIINWGTVASIGAGAVTTQVYLQHTWPTGFLGGTVSDIGAGCIPYGISAGTTNSSVAIYAPQYVVNTSGSVSARGTSGASFIAIGY